MNFNPSTKKIWLTQSPINSEFSINICKEIELAVLDDSVELIEILIDSGGGDDSWKMIALFIERSPKAIYTIAIGQCYSSAMLILQSGHKRYGTKFARFLTHSGTFNIQGKVDHLDKIVSNAIESKKFRDLYLFHKTELVDKVQSDLIAGENYFGPKEALEYGFIDEIV